MWLVDGMSNTSAQPRLGGSKVEYQQRELVDTLNRANMTR
jgi:hypothetical protein